MFFSFLFLFCFFVFCGIPVLQIFFSLLLWTQQMVTWHGAMRFNMAACGLHNVTGWQCISTTGWRLSLQKITFVNKDLKGRIAGYYYCRAKGAAAQGPVIVGGPKQLPILSNCQKAPKNQSRGQVSTSRITVRGIAVHCLHRLESQSPVPPPSSLPRCFAGTPERRDIPKTEPPVGCRAGGTECARPMSSRPLRRVWCERTEEISQVLS